MVFLWDICKSIRKLERSTIDNGYHRYQRDDTELRTGKQG